MASCGGGGQPTPPPSLNAPPSAHTHTVFLSLSLCVWLCVCVCVCMCVWLSNVAPRILLSGARCTSYVPRSAPLLAEWCAPPLQHAPPAIHLGRRCTHTRTLPFQVCAPNLSSLVGLVGRLVLSRHGGKCVLISDAKHSPAGACCLFPCNAECAQRFCMGATRRMSCITSAKVRAL